MTETRQLALPLLMPAQAQKHVTVNEALVRLDALACLTLDSRMAESPPPDPAEGAFHAVPQGAGGAWSGQAGRLALHVNGGWLFLDPRPGWRAWIADEARPALWDGAVWRSDVLALSPSGAATRARIVETLLTLAPGESVETGPLIPAGAMVIGVTGRVVSTVSGTLGGMALGVAGAEDRYGHGLGLGAGGWIRGLSGTPVTYYAPTALRVTAEGGAFAAGSLRLCVHLWELEPPG